MSIDNQTSITTRIAARVIQSTDTNGLHPSRADPPAMANISPLHAIIWEDIQAMLPVRIRELANRASSLSEAHEWICAATIYRHLANDTVLAELYMRELQVSHASALRALALATCKRDMPRPTPGKVSLADDAGLLLQVAFMGVLLWLRVSIFSYASWLIDPMPALVKASNYLPAVILPDFNRWPATCPNQLLRALFFVVLWCVLESQAGHAGVFIRHWPRKQVTSTTVEADRHCPFNIIHWIQKMHLGIISIYACLHVVLGVRGAPLGFEGACLFALMLVIVLFYFQLIFESNQHTV